MRKTFLLPLLLGIASAGYGREVSPQQAQVAADDFLKSIGAPISSSPKKSLRKASTAEDGNSPYYMFTADGDKGFVIVSGDDRTRKILGYSDSGTIDPDNLPPQLKALLDDFSLRIQSRPDVLHESWTDSPLRSNAQEILLPTANWGQGFPYNVECPSIDGQPSLTGCVATAMAIVMKYHNWPDGYDWNAMPMNTDEEALDFDAPNPELARIMHDAGEAVFMEYGTEVSNAYLDWIGHRLQNVFHYSPECQYIGGDHFDRQVWLDMLRGNIDGGNPVIYDGFGTGGHHAFIIDGYKADEYHVNWGWNGLANGYYAIDALTPFEGEDFTEYNGMIMNIVPDRSLGEYSECFVDYGYLWAAGANRLAAMMNVSAENIRPGEPFHLFNSLVTVTPGFDGFVGVAVVDQDGNIKEVLRSTFVSSFDAANNLYFPTTLNINYYNLLVSCDIDSSDRLQLVSKHTKDPEYKLILGTMEWPSSIPVSGNIPLECSLNFNVSQDVVCRLLIEESGQDVIELPTGESSLKVYEGAQMSLFIDKRNPESDNPLHLEMHGRFFTGDSQAWTGQEPTGMAFQAYGDSYDIQVMALELVDEAIHLDSAGSLKDRIDAGTGMNIGALTVTGVMDATDFWFIRDNCPSLSVLDLSGVEIVEYVGGDGLDVPEGMVHPAGTLPYRALCGLSNVETLRLPESLTAIEGFSLMGMALRSVSVPAGVSSIGQDTFYANYELEGIELLNPEPVVMEFSPFDDTKCPFQGVLFVPAGSGEKYGNTVFWKDFSRILERTMPDPLKSIVEVDGIRYECFIDEAQVVGYEGEPVDVVIPETLSLEGHDFIVTAIRENAFNNCLTLESLSMPNTIREIGYNAFFCCIKLRNLTLSDQLTAVGYCGFKGCVSLEEFIIGPKLRYLDWEALADTGIKSIFIPKTLSPGTGDSAFGGNVNLKDFEVEEGHEDFAVYGGCLYRIGGSGLTLESVPAGKTGDLEVEEDCIRIMSGAFRDTGIRSIVFNNALETIESNAVSNAGNLIHITLPETAFIRENAFFGCSALESVTFTGQPDTYSEIFCSCPALSRIYVAAPEEEMINLDGHFSGIGESVDVFSPSLTGNFDYSGAHRVFVPGGCSDNYGQNSDGIVEMWAYAIDRHNGVIAILPSMDGIVIDKVAVNGQIVEPSGNLYPIPVPAVRNIMTVSEEEALPENPDVQVDYTLHGIQRLSTHYTPEFNATVEDMETGVGNIAADTQRNIAVYTADGIMVMSGISVDNLSSLAPGIYLVCRDGRTVRIAITR